MTGIGPATAKVKFMKMREVTEQEYLDFAKEHEKVIIEGKTVKFLKNAQLDLFEPDNFEIERTTVWSFEKRGRWATHRSDYRANWAPQIPRNLILRYTSPEDTILDQMVGSGTTLIECKLLGRNGIGVDINYEALMVTWNRLHLIPQKEKCSQKLYLGDARNLELIPNESIDLIATHPPYMNIVKFSKHKKIEGDLSQVSSIDEFIEGIKAIAKESYRVLKPGKHCTILIGDTHKHKHYVPISFRVLTVFLDAGFILREQVIKLQWHTDTMRGKWKKNIERDFLLTFHEHLFIFRKPAEGEDIKKFKNSMKWW